MEKNIYHLGHGAGKAERLRKEEVLSQLNMFEDKLGKLEDPVHLEVDPTVPAVKMVERKFSVTLREELKNELD